MHDRLKAYISMLLRINDLTCLTFDKLVCKDLTPSRHCVCMGERKEKVTTRRYNAARTLRLREITRTCTNTLHLHIWGYAPLTFELVK